MMNKKNSRDKIFRTDLLFKFRKFILFLLIFLLPLFIFTSSAGYRDLSGHSRKKNEDDVKVKAVFPPDCMSALVKRIHDAEEEIKVAIYTFTDERVAAALVKSKSSGVNVTVKYDKSQAERIDRMRNVIKIMKKGKIKLIPIKSRAYSKMHHKFAVIDKKIVATGSYNWTKTGTSSNKENLVIITSVKVAEDFLNEWNNIN